MRYLVLLLCLFGLQLQGDPEDFNFLSSEEKAQIFARYGHPGDTLSTVWARYISAKVSAVKKGRLFDKPSGISFAPPEYGRIDRRTPQRRNPAPAPRPIAPPKGWRAAGPARPSAVRSNPGTRCPAPSALA